MGSGQDVFDPRAMAEYERCFSNAATIHATCENYRAAASIDLVHDDADAMDGRKVTCPLLVLWGDKEVVHSLCEPVADGSTVSVDVRGRSLPAATIWRRKHPAATLAELGAFLAE